MQQGFFREKFDVLLIAFLFLVSFAMLKANAIPELQVTLKEITQAFMYALLALVGARIRTGNAPAIGAATTESGDIIQTGPAEPGKDNKK